MDAVPHGFRSSFRDWVLLYYLVQLHASLNAAVIITLHTFRPEPHRARAVLSAPDGERGSARGGRERRPFL